MPIKGTFWATTAGVAVGHAKFCKVLGLQSCIELQLLNAGANMLAVFISNTPFAFEAVWGVSWLMNEKIPRKIARGAHVEAVQHVSSNHAPSVITWMTRSHISHDARGEITD